MALTAGNTILATDINALKAKLVAELERRTYTGSVNTSSNKAPYTNVPASGVRADVEH